MNSKENKIGSMAFNLIFQELRHARQQKIADRIERNQVMEDFRMIFPKLFP